MKFKRKTDTKKSITNSALFSLKAFLWICFLIGSGSQKVHAQYAITPIGQPLDIWSTNDFFACSIINSTAKTPNVYLNCTIISKNNILFRAKSNVFRLNSGSTLMSKIDVETKISPIQVLYIDAQMRAVLEKTAFPADGEYEIKLDLVERTENAVLAFTQYSKRVANTSPFQLITPFDGRTIDNLNPIFTWTRPFNMSSMAYEQAYNIRVAEIYSGQSVYEALRSNSPVIRQNGLSFNLFQSSMTNEFLQGCKNYAWQVEATNNSVGKVAITNVSEIWSFKTPCDIKTAINQPLIYYQMQNEPNTTSYLAYDTLRIALEYLYSDIGQIKCQIKGLDNKVKEISIGNDQAKEKQSIIYIGDNRFAIPLNNKGLKKNNQYTLEIGDGSLKYYLSFLYLGS